MTTLEARFNLKEEVLIKAIQMKGMVDSISWDITGIQFRIVYWNDSQRYATWMYDHELDTI